LTIVFPRCDRVSPRRPLHFRLGGSVAHRDRLFGMSPAMTSTVRSSRWPSTTFRF
jgi:hypothetical protein